MQLRFGELDDTPARRQELRRQFDELRSRTPRLTQMVYEAAGFVLDQFGSAVCVTSVYRPDNPRSVHAWWRGVDIGRNSTGLTRAQMGDLALYLNQLWVYATGGNLWACVYGELDKYRRHWDHCHLQCHPDTHLRPRPLSLARLPCVPAV